MKTKIFAVLLLTCLQVSAQQLVNEEGTDCTCVPILECGFKKAVTVTIRQIQDECDDRLYICCTDDNKNPEGRNHTNLAPGTCGHRNPDGLRLKLTKANLESQYAEFPWMIQISVKKTSFSKPIYRDIAGGSLITPSAVLSATHKMTDINVRHLRVRAGEWERNSENEPFPHEDRTVNEIITREDYNPRDGRNGIAILILKSPINFKGHINNICLPPRNFDFTGNRCFVTGWGADARIDENSYRKPVNILKKIDLPVIDNQMCQEQLRQTRLGSRFYLQPSFMCAGGEKGKDACLGDGGSPLVCPIPNSVDRYYLAGIVIGGVDCGKKDVPGLYIDVSKYVRWINEHIED